MKRLAVVILVASVLTCSGTARAMSSTQDEYEDSIMHPLRMAFYLAHPIGFAAEWIIGRPFHYVISRPYLDRFFGYKSTGDDGTYRRYGDRL